MAVRSDFASPLFLGEAQTLHFTVMESDLVTPVNVTGYTTQFDLLKADDVVLSLDGSVLVGADGTIDVTVASADTAPDEVQTLTMTAGAQNDTFKATANAHESSALTIPSGGYANITAAQVKTMLGTISDFDDYPDSIHVTKSSNTYTVRFVEEFGAQNIPTLTLTSATGAAAGTWATTVAGAAWLTPGTYEYFFRRTDAAARTVLAYGRIELKEPPSWP